MLLSILIFLLAWFWIHLIYWEWYDASITIIQIISLFPLFAIIQSFLSWILTNFWRYKELMYISLFIAVINIILNYILANIFWIYWISIATIISYFLWTLILFFIYYISI
jgi:O-antigen/teichoic acid export membrane protein